MGVLKCWFDQVDVHDPEFTAVRCFNVCLWLDGIGVKFVIPGAICDFSSEA